MPSDVWPGERTETSPVPQIHTPVLRTYAQLLRDVLDEISEAVVVFERSGEVILSNRAMERLLGDAPHQRESHHTVGELFSALGARVDASTLAMLMGRSISQATIQLEGGGALECRVSPLAVHPGEQRGLMTFQEPVPPSDELSDLRRRAFHDRLTGLPNRELLLDRLNQALTRRARDGGAVGVIFLDLDGFKQINDRYGHATGDRVLVEVAARLNNAMRQADTVGRLGGDEFVVVCDGLSRDHSMEEICERLQSVLATPFTVDGASLSLGGVSVGAVLESAARANAPELLARADELMYLAKRSGSQVAIETEPERVPQRPSAGLLHGFTQALESGELQLVYLPLVSLDPRRVVAVEALLRSTRPELGGQGPLELLALAREADRVHALSRLVLHRAAAAVAELSLGAREDPLSVIVNLSGDQLADPALSQLVTYAATAAGIDQRLLGFDIPEGVLMRDHANLTPQLEALLALGCQLFVDDVSGPGLNLDTLREIGFSGIKLDVSVVATLTAGVEVPDSITDLISRAHGARLSVVAEGIANENGLEAARRLGVLGGQGYGFFGFPRPLPELKRLIA
ncbi:bifunctional diguanylate cyclase/phosphodiesterase [Conexibacter sp. DBS9H8]|uniref:putative bifunctional diguanylate cyclase/phosphodiesterase n=1 Tax=Conexibacter sp. DBS9H8 TaxID=2937801 RepID=UPI00200EC897|nr:diguanylate cyclase [Conexibacter sp. DBS9H8]